MAHRIGAPSNLPPDFASDLFKTLGDWENVLRFTSLGERRGKKPPVGKREDDQDHREEEDQERDQALPAARPFKRRSGR
jgi:hypothetical protein